MSEIKPADKVLLNKFQESQPALQSVSVPGPVSGVKLGDLLDKALSVASVKAVYDFSISGGSAATDISLGAYIPAGAIISSILYSASAAVTSAGSGATIQLKAGSQTLHSAVDAEATFTLAAVGALTVTPKLIGSSQVQLILDIGGEDLTAGKISFYVSYILP